MNEAENKTEYEMAYLLTIDTPEDKLESEVSELKNFIAENGGNVTEANFPIKRRLAYPVKKQDWAYFGAVYFNVDTENLSKIKNKLAFHKKIIRYLILNNPMKPKTPFVAKLSEKEPDAPLGPQSFDQKLESILKS